MLGSLFPAPTDIREVQRGAELADLQRDKPRNPELCPQLAFKALNSLLKMRAGMENVMFWSNLVTGLAYYIITIQLFVFVNNPKVCP